MHGIAHAEAVSAVIGQRLGVHCSHSSVLIHSAGDRTEFPGAYEYGQEDDQHKRENIKLFPVCFFHDAIIQCFAIMSKRTV